MGNKLNVALIGCGWIGEGKHVPAVCSQPDLRMAALCDIDPGKAESLKVKFGLEDAKIYTDYKEMLRDPGIDIVQVATPNPLHCEMTVAALEAGKHVLCEKPMATTKADCEKMIAAARKANRKLTVGYQWRYRPEALYVKQACDDGVLGDIYYAKAHATRYRGVPAWGEYLSGKNGGGVFIDGVPHSLDLTLWAMGNYEPKSVKANLYDRMKDHGEGNIWGSWTDDEFRVEDSGFAVVTMKNGATIYIEAAWIINLLSDDMKTTLCGTKGGLDMFGGPQKVRLNGVSHGKSFVNVVDLSDILAPGASRSTPPEEAEIRHFADCIVHDTEPFIKPEEALVVTQIIEGIYLSAKSGKEVFFE
ncbi:MAG: Gfo/Idh/MocA family oxidoreductase [Lachnospiraceae bacterium]|jgi:predicted dehydrogenase|nr:Gfo/Idh/MocA family oxidoreductase [Lachnospiraceae bacterium]